MNPAIITPAWLAKNGLITDAEMDAADVEVIHREICQFVVGSYGFDITQQRFVLRSSEEPFVKVLELAVGLFGSHLVHTPLSKVGMNYEVTYACRTAKQRLEFGRLLAPTGPWGQFGRRLHDTSPMKAGDWSIWRCKKIHPDEKAIAAW